MSKIEDNTTTKDYLGAEINVGDTVVFVQLGYRNLLTGVVVGITPKTVNIKHPMTNTCSTDTRQFHNQVIVVSKAGNSFYCKDASEYPDKPSGDRL